MINDDASADMTMVVMNMRDDNDDTVSAAAVVLVSLAYAQYACNNPNRIELI